MENISIPDVSFSDTRSLFDKKNMTVGWAFLWRLSLICSIIVLLVVLLPVLFVGPVMDDNQDISKYLDYLPLILGVGLACLVAIFVGSIFISDFVGKKIIAEHYQILVKRFIGWNILWRFTLASSLFNFVCQIPFSLIMVPMIIMGGSGGPSVGGILGLLVLNLLFLVAVMLGAIPISGWSVHSSLKVYLERVEKTIEMPEFTETESIP